ncbi:MAG: hypothetical protein CMH46_00665 [Muricauda sp.]|nr:hypothetical protein [Allomuricauda sp.]
MNKMEEARVTRIVNVFCLIVLLAGSAFVVFTLGYTTFLFINIEKETTRNKVAALLLERQATLDELRVTPGLEANYHSYTEEKRLFHPFENLYNP